MVNWDPKALTALSDEEVIYKEEHSKLYYLRYKVEGDAEGRYAIVATTRPETIMGGMFGMGTVGFTSATVSYELLRCLPLLVVSVVAATPYPAKLLAKAQDKHPRLAILRPILIGLALLVAMAYMVSGTFSPFLYYIF